MTTDSAVSAPDPALRAPILRPSARFMLSHPAHWIALGFGAGADTNRPMAIAVIGGMVSSTLLTLVVVPAVYSLVEQGLRRMQRRS